MNARVRLLPQTDKINLNMVRCNMYCCGAPYTNRGLLSTLWCRFLYLSVPKEIQGII